MYLVPLHGSDSLKDLDQLAYVVDCVLTEEVEKILQNTPRATHLTKQDEELDERYYIRHRIETVARIRLSSRFDALALARMVGEDYPASRLWSRYVAQELSHDLLFINDLQTHGISEETVLQTPPFRATTEMVNFIEGKIEQLGSIPAVAYSICTEWNADRAAMAVVTKAERRFSAVHVSGAKAHLGIDISDDHYGMMLNVAHRLLNRHGNEETLVTLLLQIMSYYQRYFEELHDATV